MRHDDESLQLMWEFTGVVHFRLSHRSEHAPSWTRTESHFAGSLSEDVHQTFMPRLAEGKGQVTEYPFSFQTHEHSVVRHKVSYSTYARMLCVPAPCEDGFTGGSGPPSTLYSDQFGFRQGLDDGRVIWRRLFGLGWASDHVGRRAFPVKMYMLSEKVGHVVDDGSREETMKQTVVLVTQRRAHNGTVAMLDEFLHVKLYPDTPATCASLTRLATSLRLMLPTRATSIPSPGAGGDIGASVRTQLVGRWLSFNDDVSTVHVAYPTWRIILGPGEMFWEKIWNGRDAGQGPTIGKVLGDQRTLYKYLNRHLRVVLTEVLDSVKGTVFYRVRLPAPEGRCNDVHTALVDHWLVYAYYEDGTGAGGGGTKGWRIVSVEVYEGKKPDDVTRSLELLSYSNATTDFTTYEQAYLIPYGVTALSTTSTQLGITLKNLIVASRRHDVHSVPRRLLDPRRSLGKVSPAEAEEGLVTYDVVLLDDARLALSHNYGRPWGSRMPALPHECGGHVAHDLCCGHSMYEYVVHRNLGHVTSMLCAVAWVSWMPT
ncbi:hypothetical protein EDD17DRAFT_1903338 [Pisolithus thermaeus]|nr:hypothetical protein EDD17DRAFT_1903338 [Pisolithus thermaeus]